MISYSFRSKTEHRIHEKKVELNGRVLAQLLILWIKIHPKGVVEGVKVN